MHHSWFRHLGYSVVVNSFNNNFQAAAVSIYHPNYKIQGLSVKGYKFKKIKSLVTLTPLVSTTTCLYMTYIGLAFKILATWWFRKK